MTAAAQVADAVIVNLLFVLCSLPVVTAGAAWAGLQGAMLDAARDEGSRPAATFVGHLRRSWLPASVAWLAMLAVGGGLWLEFVLLRDVHGTSAFLARAAIVTGGLVVAGWAVWFFPFVASGVRGRRAATNALRMSLAALPRTAVAVVAALLPVVVLWVFPSIWQVLLSFMLVIGFASVALLGDLAILRPLGRVLGREAPTARAD